MEIFGGANGQRLTTGLKQITYLQGPNPSCAVRNIKQASKFCHQDWDCTIFIDPCFEITSGISLHTSVDPFARAKKLLVLS